MNTEWREIKRRWRKNQKKKRKHAHAKAFVSHSYFHSKHTQYRTHTWKWKYAAPHLPFFLLILFYLNSFFLSFSFHSIPFLYIFKIITLQLLANIVKLFYLRPINTLFWVRRSDERRKRLNKKNTSVFPAHLPNKGTSLLLHSAPIPLCVALFVFLYLKQILPNKYVIKLNLSDLVVSYAVQWLGLIHYLIYSCYLLGNIRWN